jgi:hypothetical protein
MKAIGRLFKILTRTVLWAILIALIIPVGYFVVRMGQPMDLPEYKGLTYFQYLEWGKLEHEKSAVEYEVTHEIHPDAEGTNIAGGCVSVDRAFGHAGRFFSQPLLMIEKSIMADKPFDYVHFLPDWWASFEKDHLNTLRGNSNLPVCNIPASIPDEYAISVGAKLPEVAQE